MDSIVARALTHVDAACLPETTRLVLDLAHTVDRLQTRVACLESENGRVREKNLRLLRALIETCNSKYPISIASDPTKGFDYQTEEEEKE